MVRIHNLGFPRIGKNRELKFALESYWKGKTDQYRLEAAGRELRNRHWQLQKALDMVPVGDFSFYDHVEDMSFLLGNIPERVSALGGDELDLYFRLARGRAVSDKEKSSVAAGEMTKWFDTNYHYIVPEFTAGTWFQLNAERLISQVAEARAQGYNPKPIIIGPITYLLLGKNKDGSKTQDLLKSILPAYGMLLEALAAEGVKWVQIDEPMLVTDLNKDWASAYKTSYNFLKNSLINILLTTYFGPLEENLDLAFSLPVQGIHLDAVRGREEAERAASEASRHDKILSLGVIDGRNIWKADLEAILDWLEPIGKQLGDRLWLAPSCSMLHVPVDLENETALAPELKSWLAFAIQKLEELQILSMALNGGRGDVSQGLSDNATAVKARRESARVHNPDVEKAVEAITPDMTDRISGYPERAAIQGERFRLPLFPTTTIGSFPQTDKIRGLRRSFKNNEINEEEYLLRIKRQIAICIDEQEKIGLDVLVHGEAERNDMVEYFGELLDGFAFTKAGWVQSYGSRCVKPPIIFGDVSRPRPMTVDWIRFAQSLTDRIVKGMLTGPVTILNWSFVRDDQPRSRTCMQIALAIRAEARDLEKAGTPIIQIDEPALREGLPLRDSKRRDYLDWAVRSFRIAANGVDDRTQVHTHMCYGEFKDIIQAIADLDADVITIETSRSDMELLDVFDDFKYPNGIGPGVYDIHSPNIPSVEQIINLMRKAGQKIPHARLWVNPDCGLKTRTWEEVTPSLKNMVKAASILREKAA